MPLHPEIARVVASLPAPPPGPIDPAVLRGFEESQVPPLESRLPLHDVVDREVPTGDGSVPVRIYSAGPGESYGVIVYFHGGAFFLGSLETHDHVARELAAATGFTVVSVGYRRAPEAAFPAGLDDCCAVVRWVAEHGDELGWSGRTLALAGDSSGGNFVAAVAALAHDQGFAHVTHQVLFYPSLDLDFDTDRYASRRENAVGYGLETAGLAPFNAFYLRSGADPDDPRVSPLRRGDFGGLPKALVITAKFDPLRDEGELYAQRLRDAGVGASVARYEGANHGFVQNFSWIPEYHRVFDQTAAFLQGAS